MTEPGASEKTLAFQAPVSWGQELPLSFVPGGGRLSWQVEFSILASSVGGKKNNFAVSCKHNRVMETNVFSFGCEVGGNRADQVSWPGSGSQNVPSHFFFFFWCV